MSSHNTPPLTDPIKAPVWISWNS